MTTGINMFKNGDKVLVRTMECTNKEYDQWEVVYKTAIISQENILSTGAEKLCTVKFSNGECEHVWEKHLLEFPKEWLDRGMHLC